jgi:hypothetical protein
VIPEKYISIYYVNNLKNKLRRTAETWHLFLLLKIGLNNGSIYRLALSLCHVAAISPANWAEKIV